LRERERERERNENSSYKVFRENKTDLWYA
jgi:hypothetical protein